MHQRVLDFDHLLRPPRGMGGIGWQRAVHNLHDAGVTGAIGRQGPVQDARLARGQGHLHEQGDDALGQARQQHPQRRRLTGCVPQHPDRHFALEQLGNLLRPHAAQVHRASRGQARGRSGDGAVHKIHRHPGEQGGHVLHGCRRYGIQIHVHEAVAASTRR